MIDAINRTARRVPVWALYWIGVVPPLWWLWLGLTGGLGAEPIEELEHRLGELALQMLVLGLCVTPLCRHVRINLFRFRRAIGLLAFLYVCLHLLVWLVLDVRDLGAIWADILKRPYITVGMVAFALLVPLALTSTDRACRRMGASWRKLHRLVYPAVALGGLHFVMLSKGFQIEPLLYAAAILLLLALRIPARVVRRLRAA